MASGIRRQDRVIKITPRGIATYCLVCVFSTSLAYSSSPEDLTLGLGVGIILATSLGLIAWLFSQIVRILRISQTLIGLSFFALILGVARGIGMSVLSPALGLEDPLEIWARLTSSALTTTFWFVLCNYLAFESLRFETKYRALENQLSLASAKLTWSARADMNWDLALNASLRSLGARVRNHQPSPKQFQLAAQAIRDELENVVKPFTNSLWAENQPNRIRRGFFFLFKKALLQLDFKIWRVLAFEGLINLAGGLATYSIERNLLNLSFLALVAGCSMLLKELRPKFQRKPILGSLLFLMLIGTVPLVLTDFIVQWFGYPSAIFPITALTLFGPLSLCGIILFDSGLNVLTSSRKRILDDLEKRLDSLSRSQDAERAGFIHNTIQSELTGLALQLESAARSPKSSTSLKAWQRLGSLANRSISEDFANFKVDPKARLNQIRDSWDGIAEVKYDFDPEIFADTTLANIVRQIVEEAVSNAVRHGGADQISFRMCSDSRYQLEIRTNGENRSSGPAGIGSSWVEAIAFGSVELLKTEGGTLQVITLS